ncbi:AAA family ATPase [Microcoleus sp. FACHB-53]|nr:AAA family ATPase [Microcoleus sp. FACHB-53]
MIKFPGFTVIAQIHENANSLVYRGLRQFDQQPIILKLLKEDYPTPSQLFHYRQEYETLRTLNIEGVVKVYDLQNYHNTLVMLVEDFGGESLKIWLSEKPFSLSEFLPIALQITQTLGQIHHHNIIHKDINPSNLVFNPQTGQVKLIDFGISTVLARENPSLTSPQLLEGTLAYISPEQTGRMNRSLDYRTDFYSLGVTFYELLTHQLPFQTQDALELVHCHIAKQPVPPHILAPDIPQPISDIVMKLMAKTAEERYQSAWGIHRDLAECWNQLQERGKISEFILATADISDRFQIPQKLYGREREVEVLLRAFERVASGEMNAEEEKSELFLSQIPNRKSQIEMMLVAGYSGIGKSVLVQELYKPITQRRGYFIRGKFEQFHRNVPYSAVIQALAELVRQLLTEREVQLQQWREKLLQALGANGQVIIDVIPEVELIVGSQSAVPTLGATESQNRFNLVFQNFIQVFVSPLHPLVIFLDDLQWADRPSLKLMELLMTSSQAGLFLIGAYRDNEVSAAHPLRLTLKDIKDNGAIVNEIFLKRLDLPTVNQLISDTLNCPRKRTWPLAELVLAKTEGNPFFMNEFLKSLYTENLLNFIPPQSTLEQGEWQWDLAQIKARGITDNVVELMAAKIQKLPESTQECLKLAACIGNQFDLKTLAVVSEKSQKETAINLHPAVTEGLIFPISDAYEVIRGWEQQEGKRQASNTQSLISSSQLLIPVTYKFVHDRIQQAVYSLISDALGGRHCRIRIHRQVGQLLLQNIPAHQREERIFDIVNQLNLGIELISHQSERDELAQLNLMAGKKAKASVAYEPAFKYLIFGIELLNPPQSPLVKGGSEGGSSWQRQYNLTLELYVEAAEAAYLSTNFELMERLAEVVLQHATTLLDKVKIYEIKIQSFIAQNRLLEAINTGIEILCFLGLQFPQKPTTSNIILSLIKTKLTLLWKQIENLIDLPEMTDPLVLAAMRLMSSVGSAAYLAVPELMPLLVFKGVNLSVKHGNTSESAFAYATYGSILSGVVGDIDSGYQLGKLALSLLDKFNAKKIKAKTFLVVNNLIRHWKEHLGETLPALMDSYESGIETGDLEFAALSINAYVYHGYFIGKELSGLEQEMAIYSQVVAQLKQETTLYLLKIWRQTVLTLLGRTEHQCRLIGEAYDEEKMLPLHQEANDRTAIFILYFNKLVLCYLFTEYQEAVKNAAITERYLDGGLGVVTVPLFHFYDSLALLAIYPSSKTSVQKRILRKVRANQKKMKKWAHYSPANFLHKFYLVEAERCRVLGQEAKAIEWYDYSIAGANENGYIQEKALAYELAAKFYLSKNKDLISKAYIQEARYSYLKWGATRKVMDLEENYPQLLAATKSGIQNGRSISISTNPSSGEALDLATVMKATQAISCEIVLDKLLESLMKILIENAGAQKGFLILETKGQLRIEASGEIDSEEITVLQSIPIESVEGYNQTPLLSSTLINYVARTQESVVLNDATREGQFINDSYIQTHQSKSVLCTPLLNQGKLSGIVCLENNLTTGAFTPERIEILSMLSAQAAISIENARLYSNMAELNTAYERFVPRQFLQFLEKESIVDVQLGDQIQQEMSVLFSDIRDFTTLSESMTPQENFKFINSYLSRMEPAIRENQGFIDKYIGDAIMALFSGAADNALKAGIAMLHRLSEYNQNRMKWDYGSIQIGIGINTGSLMLGTVGGSNRMDGTVISDAVNLASRVESLTKNYGIPLLITHQTFSRLSNPLDYKIRRIDQVKVKGKSELVTVYEVFDADLPEIKEGKLATLELFKEALFHYTSQDWRAAEKLFSECLRLNPMDKVAQIYWQRCQIND